MDNKDLTPWVTEQDLQSMTKVLIYERLLFEVRCLRNMLRKYVEYDTKILDQYSLRLRHIQKQFYIITNNLFIE
jgi:hypothetical protein